MLVVEAKVGGDPGVVDLDVGLIGFEEDDDEPDAGDPVEEEEEAEEVVDDVREELETFVLEEPEDTAEPEQPGDFDHVPRGVGEDGGYRMRMTLVFSPW